jgi:hypothetical protein
MPSYFSFCYEFCYRSILAKKWNQNLKYKKTGSLPTYNHNIEARSHSHICHGKTISITYSDGVFVALLIRHAKPLRRAILSSVASPARQYFSTLFHERHDFRGKNLLDIKCVFWFSLQLLSERFLFLKRNERDVIINVRRYSCQVPVIFIIF